MKTKVILLFFLLFLSQLMYSQCAMCKAVVESNIDGGGLFGININNGILYLMGFPYLLIAVVGYFIYKHYKKNKSASV